MSVNLKPIARTTIEFTIVGTSSLIQHQWSEKARKQIRDKKAGKKTKEREPCNPQAEFESAQYLTADGRNGIPLTAFKKAMIGAAHKDIGIEKTLIKKSFFIPCTDPNGILPFETFSEPTMREDYVRVGMGGTDLRYRPEFAAWSVKVTAIIDSENLRLEDVINLVDRAGFGVGLCEWRPEKGGDHGRFQIDTTKTIGDSIGAAS